MAKEKTTGIYFKVSDKERQLIEQRMEDAGVSNMSAFIRKMCLNGLIVRLDIPQIPDCSKYLKSASNNLNQIARRLNSDGGYYPQDLLYLMNHLFGVTGNICAHVVADISSAIVSVVLILWQYRRLSRTLSEDKL